MTSAVPAAGAAAALLMIAPAAHAAPEAKDPPSPLRSELHAPLAGHVTVAAHMRATRRDLVERRLRRRVRRLERSVARERGVQPDRPRLREDAPADLRDRVSGLRDELAEARAPEPVAVPAHLAAIAACESGGDPTAIGGGGLYRGKYQFDMSTWSSVGGTGDPAAAPEAEQDMRAAMLYEQRGAAPWPVCGQ
jgi:Transglycosylase-like domain